MYAVSTHLLNANLSERALHKEQLPEEVYRNYLGGYGLGVSLLMECMGLRTDPLGPENILGFATGCLTGTGTFIASRYMAFAESPSTKGFGDNREVACIGPARLRRFNAALNGFRSRSLTRLERRYAEPRRKRAVALD